MTRQDAVSLAGSLLFALIAVPSLLLYGRKLVKGRHPKKGSFEYNRGLTLINMYNWLTGGPIQGEPYAWQWKIFGYIEIGLAVFFALWIPYAVYLMIKG